jgi:hypothetical protein
VDLPTATESIGGDCARSPVFRRNISVTADRLLAIVITPVGLATPVVD